jgi:hypothetical protein
MDAAFSSLFYLFALSHFLLVRVALKFQYGAEGRASGLLIVAS